MDTIFAARLLDMLSYYSDPEHAYQDVGGDVDAGQDNFGFKILTLLTIVIGSLILSVFLHSTISFLISIVLLIMFRVSLIVST